MKMLIKFLSDEPILNVLSPIYLKPEETVFIGKHGECYEREGRRLSVLLRALGAPGSVRYIPVDVYDTERIIRELETLHMACHDCLVDVSGSNNAVIFAVGAFCRAMAVPTMTFDPDEACFRNISGAQNLEAVRPKECFTVDKVLRIAGGSMSQHGHIGTEALAGPLGKCVPGVWDVFCRHRREWSGHVSWLQRAAAPLLDETGRELPDTLEVRADEQLVGQDGKRQQANPAILRGLAACGAIEELRIADGRVAFRFPSAQLRSCLKDPGIWLELYTCQTAMNTGVFDDVQISVVVDWDGRDEVNNLINEIDVTATRGLRPLFISCKIGNLTPSYINEIYVLCDRFGGCMAQAAIVTMSTPRRDAPALMKRAESLGVAIIDRDDIERGRLETLLTALVRQR